MSKNLEIYNRVRCVPQEAQKTFNNGRFSGTDINAMWRIKMLTETFGIVGFGWRTEIVDRWQEAGANGEVKTFVRIHLYVKNEGEWSEAIEGIGGSHFISTKTNKYDKSVELWTNDECYKMAYTDAIGVACKALGVGADVYWNSDRSKYTDTYDDSTRSTTSASANATQSGLQMAIAKMMNAKDRNDALNIWNAYKQFQKEPEFVKATQEIGKKYPSTAQKK